MTRRHLLASFLPAALQSAPPLRLAKIDTLHFPKGRDSAPFWPHWTWLRLTTTNGLQAVGETYPRTAQEAEMVHSLLAPMLRNRDLRDIERIWTDLYQTFDYQIAGGTEIRILSALDLALWDLLGKTLNAPVWQLLGGRSNPKVRLYNTCFPHKHDFLTDPDKIVREVRDQYGVTAIKVWPFDGAARRTGGQYITQADIDKAIAPIAKLRDAFGSSIEIAIEFHSHWNLPAAIRIARALEPLRPMWLEDMLLPGNFAQYRQLAEDTSLPLIAGERMAGRLQFQQILDSRALKYVMFDVCWCGGISEARKIAAMASAQLLPVAPHTAGGPLLFYASTHLTTALSNVWIQESCQRFYEHDWPLMLEEPLVPKDGAITAPDLPGFGMRIKPEIWSHPAAQLRTTMF
ncbi:MAG: mandelate racemase/muconate lactonizing enzyme family protein [Bryobacterales bacterium]|nr:mandelate racemase/muconate lactonizing enzyme family protein [Bryobacterales bacterium]